MSLTLSTVQQCDLSINPVDAKGNPAAVDGAPVWASSDPTVVSLVASGTTATIVAQKPGTAQVTVSADADLGTGVTTITGVLDVIVVAAQAVAIDIKAGTPVTQPVS